MSLDVFDSGPSCRQLKTRTGLNLHCEFYFCIILRSFLANFFKLLKYFVSSSMISPNNWYVWPDRVVRQSLNL